jgi:hypothetical protein
VINKLQEGGCASDNGAPGRETRWVGRTCLGFLSYTAAQIEPLDCGEERTGAAGGVGLPGEMSKGDDAASQNPLSTRLSRVSGG